MSQMTPKIGKNYEFPKWPQNRKKLRMSEMAPKIGKNYLCPKWPHNEEKIRNLYS